MSEEISTPTIAAVEYEEKSCRIFEIALTRAFWKEREGHDYIKYTGYDLF